MVRNWDTIRRILEWAEADELQERIEESNAPRREAGELLELYEERIAEALKERDVLLGHVELLIDAGCIAGITIYALGNVSFDPRVRLTMRGHDLLSTLRTENFWQQIKQQIKGAGLALTIESIKTAAQVITKNALS